MEGYINEYEIEDDDEVQRNLKHLIESDQSDFNKTYSQAWRKELKEGDMIDVSLEIPRSQGDYEWVQAKIVSVGNDEILQLDFIFDKWQQKTRISMWSVKIEQFGIHTKETKYTVSKVIKRMKWDHTLAGHLILMNGFPSILFQQGHCLHNP
ncbi:UNKNOWN [Stylonychia lemnae]|uniref:Uncharacterized protein n=1 Tax=Stylonychia lemnae TaxID=5949 RepID=A0A077ZY58_STYLE|nr:UNKNOWN [Stylonychia lemnae]|eukprot:CDW74567.1 UNKNOWN [Stylonychia lemnae]